MGIRRVARQRALQILYGVEITGQPLTEAVEGFLAVRAELESNSKPMEQFTFDLSEKCLEHLGEIDARLKSALINWRFERLSATDRLILRLGCAELLFFDDIPPRVTINEFIEIARSFGDNESPHFVNGVLDRIARGENFDMSNMREKVRLDGAETGQETP
ncbi:transcription antitermination factor NusB [Candidatus Sumerlaeota bacterium]|nr:transcription antitermination factor NusB [Candidatus Sumerlaeota bacterium]